MISGDELKVQILFTLSIVTATLTLELILDVSEQCLKNMNILYARPKSLAFVTHCKIEEAVWLIVE